MAPTRRTGGWKLAYADFLTALCALFLVLWLVHGATTEQKTTVAEQFGSEVTVLSSEATEPDLVANLSMSLQASALLSAANSSISLTELDNGLRIDLMDPDRAPMFEKGVAALNAHGETLIALTALALSPVDYLISIEGHTDSDPVRREGYSNWDLSTDRANAARRGLVANGLSPDRVRSVAGLADTVPLDTAATNLPLNRRLSIVIHIE
jgi:chemotaxis protein MotB